MIQDNAAFGETERSTTLAWVSSSTGWYLLQRAALPTWVDHASDAWGLMENQAMAQGKFTAATQFVPSIKSTLLSHNPVHYSD